MNVETSCTVGGTAENSLLPAIEWLQFNMSFETSTVSVAQAVAVKL